MWACRAPQFRREGIPGIARVTCFSRLSSCRCCYTSLVGREVPFSAPMRLQASNDGRKAEMPAVDLHMHVPRTGPDRTEQPGSLASRHSFRQFRPVPQFLGIPQCAESWLSSNVSCFPLSVIGRLQKQPRCNGASVTAFAGMKCLLLFLRPPAR
jgi:hypothetical protein